MTDKQKNKLVKDILNIIDENSITTIKGIVTYLPIQRTTFYNHGFDKNELIKDAIENKKVELKEAMRKKWFTSDHPTLQIALYKLLADKDERDALSNTNSIKVDSGLFDDMTKDEINEAIEIYVPRSNT